MVDSDQQRQRRWFNKKRFTIPLGVLALAVLVNACGGGGKNTAQNSSTISTTAAPAVTTAAPTTSAAPVTPTGEVCARFWTFYSDLTSKTPHYVGLGSDTEAIQAAAQAAAQHESPSAARHMLNDATALNGYVHSSSWNDSGNALSDQVQNMLTDCAPNAAP